MWLANIAWHLSVSLYSAFVNLVFFLLGWWPYGQQEQSNGILLKSNHTVYIHSVWSHVPASEPSICSLVFGQAAHTKVHNELKSSYEPISNGRTSYWSNQGLYFQVNILNTIWRTDKFAFHGPVTCFFLWKPCENINIKFEDMPLFQEICL